MKTDYVISNTNFATVIENSINIRALFALYLCYNTYTSYLYMWWLIEENNIPCLVALLSE